MIRDAETSRARILDVPGTTPIKNSGFDRTIVHSALLDEGYLVIGSHLEESIKNKIGNGEYVDFSKLIPKDRVNSEEDHRMEIVNRGGMSYWIPVSDHESTSIMSFAHWEQAFRVFSNVYQSYHPNRAGELIQYNHVIYTASQTFIWDNVYHYDREFRIHMSKHHLVCSWAVILQQAWSMCLKDKHNNNSSNSSGYAGGGGHGNSNGRNQGMGPRRKLCFRF